MSIFNKYKTDPEDVAGAKERALAIISSASFFRARSLISEYKVRNAERGNIYTANWNTYWIDADKQVALDCRDEYYRVKALIEAATTVSEVETAYDSQDFESIVITVEEPT